MMFSLLAFLLLWILGLAIGSAILFSITAERNVESRLACQNVGSELGLTVQSNLVSSVSAVVALSGLVQGLGEVPINHNATNKTDRMQLINTTSFERFARVVKAKYIALGDVQLQPSAIVNQAWPNTGAVGHDLLNDPNRRVDVLNTINRQDVVVAGPFTLVQGGFALIVRYPVWLSDNKTWDTWWGLCGVLIFVDTLLDKVCNFDVALKSYTYKLTFFNANTKTQDIIRNNTALDNPVFEATGRNAPINVDIPLEGGNTWNLLIVPEAGFAGQMTATDIILLVVLSMVAAAAVILIAHCLLWLVAKSKVAAAEALVPTGEVALLFTDVEGSTEMWETDEVCMHDAMSLHDTIVRRAIKENNGYEVKTEGDAFFISFSETDDALQCAVDIQTNLMNAPWPKGNLETLATYKEEPFNKEKMTTGAPTNFLWRGFRVRMGIHLGLPIPLFDSRTLRGDYLGPTVNLAARVAGTAHGGEIRMSKIAIDSCSTKVIQGVNITACGEVTLKGIQQPVPIVSVVPTALADRRFIQALGREITLHHHGARKNRQFLSVLKDNSSIVSSMRGRREHALSITSLKSDKSGQDPNLTSVSPAVPQVPVDM